MKHKGSSKGLDTGKARWDCLDVERPWTDSWNGRSGVHSVDEHDTWQPGAGGGTVLFGLETTKSSTEEALSKEKAVKCEDARRMRESPSMHVRALCVRIQTQQLTTNERGQTSTLCIRHHSPKLRLETPFMTWRWTAAGIKRTLT